MQGKKTSDKDLRAKSMYAKCLGAKRLNPKAGEPKGNTPKYPEQKRCKKSPLSQMGGIVHIRLGGLKQCTPTASEPKAMYYSLKAHKRMC